MGRGVVRAAAYLPRFTDGRRRVAGADEDAFTLAATALELAAGPQPADDRTHALRLLGLPGPPDVGAFAAVLGAPVRPTPPVPEPPSAAGAVELALRGSGPEWIVAVAAPGADAAGGPAALPGDGAVALLIDDAPDARPFALVDDRSAPTPRATAFAQLFAAGRPGGTGWPGDWGVDPAAGIAASSRPMTRSEAPPYTVSQGAFVPTARYEESRPSRWRFVADRCGSCGARTFPSRGRCRNCGSVDSLRPEHLPLTNATVVAVTWIGQGGQPTEFDLQVETSGPYGVVLAEVAPDVRVTLTLTDAGPGEIRVGSKVDTVLRRLYPIEGVWRYGRKAVPAASVAARIGPSGT